MSSTAPKFASFRPKPKPKPSEQPPPEHPQPDDKHDRKPKPHRERHPERKSPPRDQSENHHHIPSTKPYFSDRRGDHDIVKYGTPNRYDIPSYRRTGYGNVLGLPGHKIDRDSSTDNIIYITPLVRQRPKRMLTDKHAANDTRRTMRLVKVAESHQTDATRDFIALSSPAKRQRTCASDGDEEVRRVDYRGIDDSHDPNQLIDPDTYYESDNQAANAISNLTQKNSRLIRETRHDPANLQAWLNLIEHQESMMKLDRAITELSAADRQNLADVRISTYEEALRKVGDHVPSQVELQAGLLREAQQHWDDAKLSAKWQDVIKRHPHSVDLWFGYLDFAQSTFSQFKYEDCRTAFLKALPAPQPTDSTDHNIAEARMHLFLRLTTMIQEAGYQELALAAWQAVLEYNLLAPQSLTTDKTIQFEKFWESEALRIGEQDSKGWRHTAIDDAVPPTCSIILNTPGGSISSIDDFEKPETEYISKLRYPGRSTDEVGEDDPFHTIFVSDLKDVIASVPNLSAELHVDAFLCFCGLPPLAGTHSKGSWWDDPYLQRSSYGTDPSLSTEPESNTRRFQRSSYDTKRPTETESDTPRFSEALSKYSRVPLADFHMTNDLLIQQTLSLQTSRLDPGFVRNALTLLATNTADGESIGEYLLAFESKYFPSELPKTAKRLLKARPTSVRLYNMYGLVEDRLGNIAKAEQVFAAALNIRSSPADRLQLLSSYVWQALQQDNKAEALRRLSLSDNKAPPAHASQPDPASIESTRSALQLSLETALLAHDHASAVVGTSLLALLTYLTGSSNVAPALQVHANLTSWFASHTLSTSPHAERHAQAIARFLAHHTTHTSIVKPSLLRDAVEPLIASFPGNTLLLATYAANEARFAIDDRIRGNTRRVLHLLPSSSAATWAFAIHHEMLKGHVAGRTTHSVRALFRAATHADARAARCPALWHDYVCFETTLFREAQATKRRDKVQIKIDARLDEAATRSDKVQTKTDARLDKAAHRVRDTFYQGLQMLPWCKEFVMLAFTAAEGVFTRDELARLYGVMAEKEMRLYTELEGVGG